jgi:histidinol-phosphatase
MTRLDDDLALALRLAAAAEAEILPRYQRTRTEWKADGSEVTEADREAERAIRAGLAAERRADDVFGEEHGGERSRGGRQWILDPIDGTTAFSVGAPGFGTLIALAIDDEPVLGVVHFPALGETLYAARGLGCWFRPRGGEPRRVRVAPVLRLADAFVSASGLHASSLDPVAPGAARLDELARRARKFRFFGDCLQHALVARGSLHVAVDTLMQPWDSAALLPCIEEAGGVVSALDGGRDGLLHAGSLISSATRALHEAALEAMR